MVENTSQIPEIPYVHSGIFLETLNTACIWSKWSAKKTYYTLTMLLLLMRRPSSGVWNTEENGTRKVQCKERTCWTRSKAFPVGVDVVSCCSFSINFYASSSSLCFIIVAVLPSLMIICYFSSRFCTSFSSSRCSAKAIWESLGDMIYHFFGTYLLRYIFDRQFWKVAILVLHQCSKDFIVIGGSLKPFIDRWPFMGVFAVWGDTRMCHWPRRWLDGAQCKCKCWFLF